LVKLVSPADLDQGGGLVCLPDTDHDLSMGNLDKKCWTTGWGAFYSGVTPLKLNTLIQASVSLVSQDRCGSAYPDAINDSVLCASVDDGGIDACQDDGGAPLVCERNGTWYLEGVKSWDARCTSSNKHGVYVKVRDVLSWLSRNMNTSLTESTQNHSSSVLGTIIYFPIIYFLVCSLHLCACLKWLLLELSCSDRCLRGTKLWERDCEETNFFSETFTT